jgi:hypothetical protein
MRKLLVLGLAVLLVAAFSLPASAIEHKFGGYWRTRMIGQADFAAEDYDAYAVDINGDGVDDVVDPGGDGEDRDTYRVDTRTRLYYTAVLNENLSLVNKFEFDAVWGTSPLGDYGADGKEFEIKESYADFNWGPMRFKVGIHDSLIARGFIFADEFSGITASYATEGMNLIAEWIKGAEGGTGKDQNDLDLDIYGLNPFVYWMFSDDGDNFVSTNTVGYNLPQQVSLADAVALNGTDVDEVSIYWLGANADFTLGAASIWATAIYQGGTIDDDTSGNDDIDVSAYLLALGASMPLGPLGVHGQFFYASGDDDGTDDDFEAFFGIGGAGVGWAYYWAEIMGLGVFDNQTPPGTPGGDVSNIMALNIGATLKPVEKLSLKGDIWYAQLVEDELGPGWQTDDGEDDLGVEIDLVATYQLIEGMNLDLVGAYLFAGDATSTTGSNDDDPYEIGARLSLSF